MADLRIKVDASGVHEAVRRGVDELKALQSAVRAEMLTTLPEHMPAASSSASLSPVHVFRRMPEVLSADRSIPRAFSPEQFNAIEPRALEQAFFGFMFGEEQKAYELNGTVAILSIDGPLSQRGGWWWDGYDAIAGRFEKALGDKAVTAVVLKINSPGGVCSGCFSSSRRMSAMKTESKKPVLAYADESAYSAAYAIACSADEIYLPIDGGVGSVGVIGVLEDYTGLNEKMGINVAVITSGKYKADGHPDTALTKEVVDRYQARITALGRSFAELVGASRGMAPEAVLKLEAACLYGDDAVRAGLANGVATLEEVVAQAQAMRPEPKRIQVNRYV